MIDVSDVARAIASVRERIAGVERSWAHEVEIVAVTKAFPPSIIDTAVAAGSRAIGENYGQELLEKRDVIESRDPHERPRVDFIGHLQSNKVRQLAGLVDRWCTIDRVSLAEEIATRDRGAHVLVQVNSTGEDRKSGCRPDDTSVLVDRCRDLGLVVEGLMTIGPTDTEPAAAARGFRSVRGLVDDLGLAECSMGMSSDLEVAVAEGATGVRIGSALFGPRPT